MSEVNTFNVPQTMKNLCEYLNKPYWEVGRLASIDMAVKTSLDAIEGNTRTSAHVRKSIYDLAVKHNQVARGDE